MTPFRRDLREEQTVVTPAVAFLTPVIMAGYISSAGLLASVKLYFVLASERRLPLESDFATAGALRSSSYDSESSRARPAFMPRSRN